MVDKKINRFFRKRGSQLSSGLRAVSLRESQLSVGPIALRPEFKSQHLKFTYSLLKKRNVSTFERIPLPLSEFDPRTSCTKGECCIT